MEAGSEVKIIYVTVGFPFGPGEAFLIPELRELVARGHQVLIVPLRPGTRIMHADAAAFVRYTCQMPLLSFGILRDAVREACRNFRAAAPIVALLLQPRHLRMMARNAAIVPKGLWLAAIARQWGADHIHAYWASSVASAAMLAGECADIPWSFSAHRHDIARNNLLAEKTRHAAFVRVISESGLRMLRAAVGDLASKAFVLHTAIQVPANPVRAQRNGRLIVFCPANLVAVKGHSYLIEAVALVRNAGVDIELWLAGDGKLRGQIERQVRERHLEQHVRMLGQMPHDALLSLYQNGEVDVVVLPSVDLGSGTHEGIPVALMEAMAYAIPVIGTETGGIPELIGGGAGTLVPPANPHALAEALTKLAASTELRGSLGLAGRRRVEQSFEVGEIVRQLVRRFNESGLKNGTAPVGEKAAMSRPQEQTNFVGAADGATRGLGSRVRMAVVMDELAPLWVNQTIEEIQRRKYLDLTLLIVASRQGPAERPAPAVFRVWSWADRLLFKSSVDPSALRREKYAIDTVIVNAHQNGASDFVFGQEDRAKIKAARLDVIVHLGSTAVPAQLLSCARYGVWSFSKAEGVPESRYAQFWELYERNCVSTLTLRAITASEKRDLYRSTFSNDKLSLYRNQSAACRLKSQIILRRLTDLYEKGWGAIQLPNSAPARALDKIPKAAVPRNAAMIRFVAGWFLRAFCRRVTNSASSERWFIAYHDKRGGPSASVKTLMPPAGWDYADPFLYEYCGKHYIFFEAASSSNPKGEIWFVELDRKGNPSPAERALRREYHLSYPMIFEWNGETYLLPESSQNRSVEVYRAVEFPRRWEFAGTLLRNVPVVDPTFFERNGKLWLFVAGVGGKDLKCNELSLFFSDSLFGPWTPHPKNPVVCDVSRARPAGSLFYRGEELIRPAQDCSECYGHAITLNRIDALSETNYRETPVGSILPDWAADLSATHTLNMNSRYEVLDAKSRRARYCLAARSRTLRLRWPEADRLLEDAKNLVPGA
jgi:colanic acid/amylovoran biosynthesis glycosyltransferase